jgi:hypothetical protein
VDGCICCAAKEPRQGHCRDCLEVHETKREEEQLLENEVADIIKAIMSSLSEEEEQQPGEDIYEREDGTDEFPEDDDDDDLVPASNVIRPFPLPPSRIETRSPVFVTTSLPLRPLA